MNDFIDALKEDLLDRRLLPFVAVAAIAVVAAIAYVKFDSPSESATTASLAHPRPVTLRSGVSITPASVERALAETTSGSGEQRGGSSHNPFGLLPGALAAASASKTSSTSGSSGSSSKSSSGSSSSGSGSSQPQSSAPTSPSKPSKAAVPKTVYTVDVLFGEIPAGATAGSPAADANLKPHAELKLLTPLPSKSVALVVYRGVKPSSKSATFTVAGEAILAGNGVCKPSPTQCEAIALKAGQSEQLQYLPAGSQTVRSYELRVISISAAEATAATVASLWKGESAAGLEVLRAGELLALPGLRTTTVAGVLVPAP